MSVFLELLRCILCCVDENWHERDESSYSRISSSSSDPSISSTRTSLLHPTFQAPIEANISTKAFPSHHLPPKFFLNPAFSAEATPSASRSSKPNLLSVPCDYSSPISKPASGSSSVHSSVPRPAASRDKNKPILFQPPPLLSSFKQSLSSSDPTPYLISSSRPSSKSKPAPLTDQYTPSIPFQSSQKVASLSPKLNSLSSEASISTIQSPFETKTSPKAVQSPLVPPICFLKQSPSSSEATSSCTSPSKTAPSSPSKPSPLLAPSNSSNQKKRTNSKWVQKGMPIIPKSVLALPSKSTDRQEKIRFEWVKKGTLPMYMSPEDIKHLIEKDIAPEVLKKPLSPSTYKDYFAALLYAEDLYLEKWSEFHLSNVTIEFRKAAIHEKPVHGQKTKNEKPVQKKKIHGDKGADEKMFAVFEIDKVREKRPYLLSRDFVFAGPPNTEVKQFQGFVCRVRGGNSVVAEFQEDFHCQHNTCKRYDISFSFNRECLKRAHEALEAALDDSLLNFLFPDPATRKHRLGHSVRIMSAIPHISSFQGPPPHLVQGPLCLQRHDTLSKTGKFICQAVLHMYQTSPDCRILICAPKNKTCDVLMRSLKEEIPEPDIFRANAAFREVEEVPDDILSSCPHEGERFVCPSISELKNYKVILSTFMSAFRLRRQGMRAGHLTHIFLVDASSATEPETIVALSGLVDDNTSVIVSGDTRDHPYWIRSNFARQNGLTTSYFERLCSSEPYETFGSVFVTDLYGYAESTESESDSSAYLSTV